MKRNFKNILPINLVVKTKSDKYLNKELVRVERETNILVDGEYII